jgi:hypothetical protein
MIETEERDNWALAAEILARFACGRRGKGPIEYVGDDWPTTEQYPDWDTQERKMDEMLCAAAYAIAAAYGRNWKKRIGLRTEVPPWVVQWRY